MSEPSIENLLAGLTDQLAGEKQLTATLRARCEALEADQERMREALEWKPMETAPMDGTRVLVFWDYWSHDAFVAYFKHGRWNGEVALSEGDTDGPTRWMPLPSVAALSTPRQP